MRSELFNAHQLKTGQFGHHYVFFSDFLRNLGSRNADVAARVSFALFTILIEHERNHRCCCRLSVCSGNSDKLRFGTSVRKFRFRYNRNVSFDRSRNQLIFVRNPWIFNDQIGIVQKLEGMRTRNALNVSF